MTPAYTVMPFEAKLLLGLIWMYVPWGGLIDMSRATLVTVCGVSIMVVVQYTL
jgi:hypothetical protein